MMAVDCTVFIYTAYTLFPGPLFWLLPPAFLGWFGSPFYISSASSITGSWSVDNYWGLMISWESSRGPLIPYDLCFAITLSVALIIS